LWHSIAQQILDANIDDIVISPKLEKRNSRLFSRISEDESFCRRIHHLTVQDLFFSGLTSEENLLHFGINEWFGLDWEPRYQSTWDQLHQLCKAIAKIDLKTFRSVTHILGPKHIN
jgi:hypothetical protein